MLRQSKYILVLPAAVIILIWITACGGSAERTEKMSRLDSISNALTHLESSLKLLNAEQVKNTYVSCKENLQKLYVVFQKDPLIVDENVLIEYEKLKISLNKLVLDLDNAEKEIQFGLQQISTWQESVKKGGTDDEEFDQYCRSESLSIHSLELIMLTKTSEWEKAQHSLQKLEPEVKRLVKNQ